MLLAQCLKYAAGLCLIGAAGTILEGCDEPPLGEVPLQNEEDFTRVNKYKDDCFKLLYTLSFPEDLPIQEIKQNQRLNLCIWGTPEGIYEDRRVLDQAINIFNTQQTCLASVQYQIVSTPSEWGNPSVIDISPRIYLILIRPSPPSPFEGIKTYLTPNQATNYPDTEIIFRGEQLVAFKRFPSQCERADPRLFIFKGVQ